MSPGSMGFYAGLVLQTHPVISYSERRRRKRRFSPYDEVYVDTPRINAPAIFRLPDDWIVINDPVVPDTSGETGPPPPAPPPVAVPPGAPPDNDDDLDFFGIFTQAVKDLAKEEEGSGEVAVAPIVKKDDEAKQDPTSTSSGGGILVGKKDDPEKPVDEPEKPVDEPKKPAPTGTIGNSTVGGKGQIIGGTTGQNVTTGSGATGSAFEGLPKLPAVSAALLGLTAFEQKIAAKNLEEVQKDLNDGGQASSLLQNLKTGATWSLAKRDAFKTFLKENPGELKYVVENFTKKGIKGAVKDYGKKYKFDIAKKLWRKIF